MRLIDADADKAIIDFNVLNKMIGDLQGDNFEPQDVLEAVLDYIDNAPKYTNAPTVQREGWVSVPIEPTEEMLMAGCEAGLDIKTLMDDEPFATDKAVYKAMIKTYINK